MDYHISTFWLTALIVLALWELIWKGFALWRSARHDQAAWFLAILLINTVGILPMVYLWVGQKGGKHEPVN